MGKLTKRVRNHISSKKKKKITNKTSKGGGCGCGVKGGKKHKMKSKTCKKRRKVKGGSAHLETLPLRYYYPLNDHSSSLSDMSSIGHSVKQFSGGKKKRKQTKGGGIIDSIFNGPQLNITTGFGTTVGTKMLYDVQTLDQPHIADVMKQPAGNLNNEHSPLLA
jgi:hypothetical protein